MATLPLGGGGEIEGDPDEDAGDDEEGREEKCGKWGCCCCCWCGRVLASVEGALGGGAVCEGLGRF